MVGVMKTDYSVEDLNFVELFNNIGGGGNNGSTDPQGSPSY
jgi:hypothetical protein